ncbi:MAG TPA: hypothetical protein VG056_08280, partial [Pirellulales bacterium]|nr:hypothetical protein [Pirellulales bacterium]
MDAGRELGQWRKPEARAGSAITNPLGQSSGLALAGSLQSTTPFPPGAPSSSSLYPPSAEGFSGDP